MMLDEVAAHLMAVGYGTVGTSLFKGTRPDDPDDLTCLYEYTGANPEYIQEQSSPVFEKPQLQVLVRSKDYETARRKAAQAWGILAQVHNAILSGVRYRHILPNGSPALLGRDANDRLLIAFNASVDKEVILVGVS